MSYAVLLGRTLIHDGVGTTPFYSPPLFRQANSATFVIEATHVGGSPTLATAIQHKNFDETSWGTAASFDNVNSPGVKLKATTALKEEIRFAFSFTAGAAGDFVHVTTPEPAWLPE